MELNNVVLKMDIKCEIRQKRCNNLSIHMISSKK